MWGQGFALLALALPVEPVALANAQVPTSATAALAPDLDLARWVERARAGEAAAFRVLYDRFARAVHAVALAKLPTSDASDAVQEVFASVHRSLHELHDAAAFPGWIMTIARRRVIDQARARSRAAKREVTDGDPAAWADAANRADAGDAAVTLEAKRALAAIRSLPETYAETLLMRLVEGLDGPAIASRTGLSPGSVRVNLHRGMALLRARLGEEVPA